MYTTAVCQHFFSAHLQYKLFNVITLFETFTHDFLLFLKCHLDPKKVDGITRLFQILKDLHDAHAAVEEEERLKNKNVFLELQT